MHTNDLHGRLPEVASLLGPIRQICDAYFDTGDSVSYGNMALPLGPDRSWPLLAELDCTASVIGNREGQLTTNLLKAKLRGAGHPVLCGNLLDKSGEAPLSASLTFDSSGLKVGVFGVSVAMVTARMKSAALSGLIWSDPVEAGATLAEKLRPEVDLLIALTHIGYRHDIELAKRAPKIDVILGGHSHNKLPTPERVGQTWIAQGGSHGRFAGVYSWSEGELVGGLVTLKPEKDKMAEQLPPLEQAKALLGQPM